MRTTSPLRRNIAKGGSSLDFPPKRKIALQPKLRGKEGYSQQSKPLLWIENHGDMIEKRIPKIPHAYNRFTPISFHVIQVPTLVYLLTGDTNIVVYISSISKTLNFN